MTSSISKTNQLIKDLHRLDQISQANHLRVDLSTGKLARSNGFRAIFEKAASSLFGAPDTCSEKVLASKIYTILDKRRDLIKPENIETIKRLCSHAGIVENGVYVPESSQQKLADLITPPEFRNVQIGTVNNHHRNSDLNEALATANIAKLFLGAATVGTLAYALSKIPESYPLNPIAPENQCITRPSRPGEMIALGFSPDRDGLATHFIPESIAGPSLSGEKRVPGNSPDRDGLVTHFAQDPVIFQNHSFCPLSDRISWTVPSLKPANIVMPSAQKTLPLPPLDFGICEFPKNSTPVKAEIKPSVAQMFEKLRDEETSFNTSFEAYTKSSAPDVSDSGFNPYNSSPPDDEETPPASNPSLDYALLFDSYASKALLSFGALFGAAALIKSLIWLKGAIKDTERPVRNHKPLNTSVNAFLNNAGPVKLQDVSSDPQSETNENLDENQNLAENNDAVPLSENNPGISLDDQTAEKTLKTYNSAKKVVEKNSTKNKGKVKKRSSQNKENAGPASPLEIANDIFNTLKPKNEGSNKALSPKALKPNESKLAVKPLNPFRANIQDANKENVNPQKLSNKLKQNSPVKRNMKSETDFLQWHTERSSSFKNSKNNAARPAQTKIGSPSKWPELNKKPNQSNFSPLRLDFSECKSGDVNNNSNPDMNLDYANHIVDMLLNKDANTINVTALCELIEEGELDGHPEFLSPLLETEFQPETDVCTQAGKILNAYFNRCFIVDDETQMNIAWDIFESTAIDFDSAYSTMFSQMEKSSIARKITATHLFQLGNMLNDEEQTDQGVYMCTHLLKLCTPYENNDACKAFSKSIEMELEKRLTGSNENFSVHVIRNNSELVDKNIEALKNGPEITASLLTKRLCVLIKEGRMDHDPEALEPFLEEEFLSKNYQNENVRNILSLYMDRCLISENGFREMVIDRIAKAIASNYIDPVSDGNANSSAMIPV